jgi:fibronectin type 3 domain-containing protein
MKNKKAFWILTVLLIALSISAYAGGSTETAQEVLDIFRDASQGTSRAPPAPTGVTAVRNPAGSTNVLVRWNAVSGATSYKVYFSRTNGGIGAEDGETTATSFNGEGYSTDRTYYFRVSAVNRAGEGTPSSWVELGSGSSTGGSTSARLLGAPTGVTAVRNPAGSTNIRVSWNAVSGATSYRVYWSNTNSGSGYLEGEPTTTSFISEDNQTNETHYFRVTAVNAAGEGTASSWISVGPVTASGGSTARVPGTPTGVTAVRNSLSSTDVRVSWNAVSGATSYRVYWSETASGAGTLEGSPTGTSFTSSNNITDTMHYFRVSAVNSAGEGASSPWVMAELVNYRLPPAPTGVTAARVYAGPTSVRVSWNEVSDAIYYRVYYSTDRRDAVRELEWVNDTEFFSANKRTDGTHYFRVSAVSAAGEGEPSAWVQVGPFNGRPPATPTGVTATRNPARPTEIRVSWNAVSGADSYKIYWTPYPNEVFQDGTSSTTTFTSTDKSTDETHYFWVLAVNAAGESERSARVTVGPGTR